VSGVPRTGEKPAAVAPLSGATASALVVSPTSPVSVARSPGRRVFAAALLALFVCGTAAGGFISTSVFDRIPHVEDEHAFLFQAKVFAAGRLYAPTPPRDEMFPIPFVLDRAGRRVGKYPPGFPLVLALGARAGQPWLVNPVLAGLGLVAIALLGRRFFDSRTGLLAAALGLTSPFYLLSSGSLMSHTATLVWLTLGALGLVSGWSRGDRRGAAMVAGAGACLALALITRPLTAIGVGLGLGVGVLAASATVPERLSGRLGWLLLGAAPILGFFVIWNTLALGGPLLSGYELWWSFDRVGFGTGPMLNFTPLIGWLNVQSNLDDLSHWLFGWPGRWSLLLPFLPFLTFSRNPWDWLLLAWAAGLTFVHLFYWAPGQMYGPRYLYEALPALMLLSARGVLRGSALLGRIVGRRRRLARFGHGAIALALIGMAATAGRSFLVDQMLAHQDWYGISGRRYAAVASVVAAPAVVLVAPEEWTTYANFSWANDPWMGGGVVFAKDFGDVRARTLLGLLPPTEEARQVYRFINGHLYHLDLIAAPADAGKRSLPR
jgi:4-amino-4-deoxy-L-arabinose transferase-like glycosyltransferase